jgi:hypothetical protein
MEKSGTPVVGVVEITAPKIRQRRTRCGLRSKPQRQNRHFMVIFGELGTVFALL